MLGFRFTRRHAVYGVGLGLLGWFAWVHVDEHYFRPRIRLDAAQQILSVRLRWDVSDEGLVPDQDGDGLPDILLSNCTEFWPTVEHAYAKRELRRMKGDPRVQLISSRTAEVLQEWGTASGVQASISDECDHIWDCVRLKRGSGDWECASDWHVEKDRDRSLEPFVIDGRSYTPVLINEGHVRLAQIKSNGAVALDLEPFHEDYDVRVFAWRDLIEQGHVLLVPKHSGVELRVIEERFAPSRATIEHVFDAVPSLPQHAELVFKGTALDQDGELQLFYHEAGVDPPAWFAFRCGDGGTPRALGTIPVKVPMSTVSSHWQSIECDDSGAVVVQAFVSDQLGHPAMLRVTRPGSDPVESRLPLWLAEDDYGEIYQQMIDSGCGFWNIGVQSTALHSVPDQDGDGVTDWFVMVDIASDDATHMVYTVISGLSGRPIRRLR